MLPHQRKTKEYNFSYKLSNLPSLTIVLSILNKNNFTYTL